MVTIPPRPPFLTLRQRLLMSRPRRFIGDRELTMDRVGLRHVTTDLATTAAVMSVVGGGSYSGLRPWKASCNNARMPSRVMGRGL